MSYYKALLLGILQGITEFLPVSSSGHLLVLRRLFGMGPVPVLYDILLHIATLLVICLVFRRKLLELILALPALFRKEKTEEQKENLSLILYIILATAVTGPLGLIIGRIDFDTHMRIVYAMFMITGLVLIFSSFVKRPEPSEKIGVLRALIIGLAQGLAVFPGLSRSGITISASVLSGVDRAKAGEFSFLISIPAILGAFVLDLKDAGELFAAVDPLAVLISFVAAFAAGTVSLVLLLRMLKSARLFYFSFYLIPLGILCFIFL